MEQQNDMQRNWQIAQDSCLNLMKMSKISIHMKLSFILGLCMPVELWA